MHEMKYPPRVDFSPSLHRFVKQQELGMTTMAFLQARYFCGYTAQENGSKIIDLSNLPGITLP